VTNEELQAIAERHAIAHASNAATYVVASLADIPRLLDAVRELMAKEVEWIGVLDETKAQKDRAVIQASNAEDVARQLRAQLAAMTAKCERLEAFVRSVATDCLRGVSVGPRGQEAARAALRDESTGDPK
jgi:hypothetical protein